MIGLNQYSYQYQIKIIPNGVVTIDITSLMSHILKLFLIIHTSKCNKCEKDMGSKQFGFRNGLIQCLMREGHANINIIKNLYWNQHASVNTGNELIQQITIEPAVRQGCVYCINV